MGDLNERYRPNKDTEHRVTRYSWTGFVQTAAAKRKPHMTDSSRNNDLGYDWDLGADYAKATELADDGWPEGAELVRKNLSAITAGMVTAPGLASTFDEEGALPDVARYLDSEPDYWVRPVPAPTKRPGVRIVASVSASCGFGAEGMARRGCAIAILAEVLRMNGYSVSVEAQVAMFDCDSYPVPRNVNHVYAIEVMAPGEIMNINKIAFALVHPAMFRRLGFSVREQHSTPDYTVPMGYGYPSGYPGDCGPDDIFIPSMVWGEDINKRIIDDPVGWIIEEAAKKGIVIERHGTIDKLEGLSKEPRGGR